MKKYFSPLLFATVALCFTGCQPDDEIAYELDGYWEGEVSQTFFNWRGYGTSYQYVDMDFYKNPYKYAEGDGMEYDYDSYGEYTQQYFKYFVHNGYIYLDYEYGEDVVIQNYSLTNNYFSGTFYAWVDDSYNDYWNVGQYLADFRFVRVSGPSYSKSAPSIDLSETRSGQPTQWKLIDNPLKDIKRHSSKK